MYMRLTLICAGLLVAGTAHADGAPTPQPAAASAQAKEGAAPVDKLASPRRAASPVLSVMRVTRQADGTLTTDCIQRPNPKARATQKGAQP